jgi:hypothetical protein
MRLKRKLYIGIYCFCGLLSLCAQADLLYQDRENRHEGIKDKPISGYDIEVISVLADYTEPPLEASDMLKIQFYLPHTQAVYITVRELDYKEFYWMDEVIPENPWEAGFDNYFEWPARDVVLPLNIDMLDLGILARLETEFPGAEERVAPVIFYHSQVPNTINGYLFTFKTSRDAELTCRLYQEREPSVVQEWELPERVGGRPFTVLWDASQAKEGYYKLVLTGNFSDDNESVEQTVRFYHNPIVE